MEHEETAKQWIELADKDLALAKHTGNAKVTVTSWFVQTVIDQIYVMPKVIWRRN